VHLPLIRDLGEGVSPALLFSDDTRTSAKTREDRARLRADPRRSGDALIPPLRRKFLIYSSSRFALRLMHNALPNGEDFPRKALGISREAESAVRDARAR